MSDPAFDPTGPEANNARAEAFETQLVAMGDTLGWETICRNIDVFIKHNGQSQGRGVDVLWAIANARTEQREGCVGEAKVHGEQAGQATVQKELQILHDKVHGFSGQQTFWNNAYIRDSIDTLRWGLLAHRTMDFNVDKSRNHLRNAELKKRQRGPDAPAMFFLGPETLEGIADCFSVAGRPKQFYWPPTRVHNGEWGQSCPPDQLAAGLVAYEREDGGNVLWLRDSLTDKDPDALAEIAHAWRMNFDDVVVTELDQDDTWRTVAKGWERTAERTQAKRSGHLPTIVRTRNLSHAHLNRFDDRWPDAA